MEEFLNTIPEDLKSFVVVALLSLLIGLEQRGLHWASSEDDFEKPVFGTDRTFALIGIFGFILYILDPTQMRLYIIGGITLGALLAIFYYSKTKSGEEYGLTSVMIAFITYCLGPLVVTQPPWMVLLIFVSVILLAELKPTLTNISRRFQKEDFTTLAKFLILTGVILPVVPDKPIFEFIPTTPYKIWLAVVIVSAISYLSYLLRKYVFRKSGILVTGLLGGLYSSTATTMILARKSQGFYSPSHLYAVSIIFSTAMMFIRIFILTVLFNAVLAKALALPFALLFIFSLGIGFLVYIQPANAKSGSEDVKEEQTNPLELKVAIIFALLFLLFSIITKFALEYYGADGVKVLSFIVGITDITPYLINLFEGNYSIDLNTLAQATLLATASNNLLKAIYTTIISRNQTRLYAAGALSLIFVATLLTIVFFI